MELTQRMADLLGQTERKLRELLAEGIATQRYGEVAHIAGITERLAELRNGLAVQQSSPSEQGPPEVPTDLNRGDENGRRVVSNQVATAEPVSNVRLYPRFETDGDKLIKIGWSERDDREYEHRAPKATVLLVCEALNRESANRRRFRMENVLPQLSRLSEAPPSYQAYLTLAWLRVAGVVDGDGKNGYRIKAGSLSRERIEELWTSLEKKA